MNLFDQLVNNALKNQPNLASLRAVVEKELLHHDILNTLSRHGVLSNLTFIGDTCLRACYGNVRLSEDLDFTGGSNFSRAELATMGRVLTEDLQAKYGLRVTVGEPEKESQNVDTWKIKVETRPEAKDIPAQRIHIDICAVPSYETQPMMLLNPYGVDMGTTGLIIIAQSREEIFADKLLAFAFRPNRVKNRDLWDIAWLHQQGIQPRYALIPKKLRDRQLTSEYFLRQFDLRCQQLVNDGGELELAFRNEMQRFLAVEQINQTMHQDKLWTFIVYLMNDLARTVRTIQIEAD